ncbi:MAG: glycosyltransferase family 2 protein [Eggerthellaceae bacterium]
MKEPLVSIIIPIYNVDHYIEACLQSTVDQTYKNIEIICVDDGSPDCSNALVREFMHHDSRIVLLEKQNGGLSDARNFGIKHASGEYLFFLDGDDCLAVNCIEKLVDLALEHGSAIAACQFEPFTTDNYAEMPTKMPTDITDTGCQLYKLSYTDTKLKITLNTAWGKLYARELLDTIRYPVGKINEDEFVTYKLFLDAPSATLTFRPLYGYRQRPGSIMQTSNKDPEHLIELIKVFERRIIEFQKDSSCNFANLVVDDCLCQISSYYCITQSDDFKKQLVDRYRKDFRLFKHLLSKSEILRRSLFYILPSLYKSLAKLSSNLRTS